MIIDEAQYAPSILRHLEVAVDAGREVNGRFRATGSQRFPLMREVSDLLAERVDIAVGKRADSDLSSKAPRTAPTSGLPTPDLDARRGDRGFLLLPATTYRLPPVILGGRIPASHGGSDDS